MPKQQILQNLRTIGSVMTISTIAAVSAPMARDVAALIEESDQPTDAALVADRVMTGGQFTTAFVRAIDDPKNETKVDELVQKYGDEIRRLTPPAQHLASAIGFTLAA